MSNRKKIKTNEKAELIAKSAEAVMMHFPQLWNSDMEDEEFVEALCCDECEDLHAGACEGKGLRAWDVVKCMGGKSFENWEFFGGK